MHIIHASHLHIQIILYFGGVFKIINGLTASLAHKNTPPNRGAASFNLQSRWVFSHILYVSQ